MNILFVGTVPFPSGTAGASRVKSLALALRSAGNKVFVLSLVPSESNSTVPYGFEDINGILYKRVPAITLPSFLRKQRTITNYRNILSGFWFGKNAAKEILVKEKIEKVIFYSWSAIEVNPILNLSRQMGVDVFADVVEYPSPDYFQGGKLNLLYWNTRKLLTDLYLKLDGVIAITSHIEDIYKEKGIPTLKVPALIAPDFYAGIPDSQFDKTQSPIILTYVGSLAAKDDPLLMLDVLKILIKKKINVQLMIIGSIIKSDISDKFLSTLKNDDELKTRIILTGRVSDSELKHSLKSSHILLLPRLKKSGVIAAFPTRLPELLLTGKPCVTTDVGDLKGYIQDGVHARLAVPGDAADMAQKTISIIEDPNFFEQLGANGKECARTRFNFETYAQPLSSFLELKR